MSLPTFRRETLARHGRLTSPRPLGQLIIVLAVVVAVALVSLGGVAAFAVWNTADTISANSVDIGGDALPPAIGEIEGAVTMLLVGTDSCEGQDLALFPRCAEDEGGERNDVTMLVHISENPRRVTVVSLPRDMLVPIPACTGADGEEFPSVRSDRINVSYTHGGLACTVATVEELTGEDIQYAAAIRWTGVINLSDAVGGVDVCVAGDISDIQNTGLQLTAGTHTLKGAEALQFLRIRHGIGDGSDLGRISNQQQFMTSLVRKLQSESVLTNPGTLLSFATVAMQQVSNRQLVLSTSLANPSRMVQIAMALRGVPFQDFVFVQYPTGSSAAGVEPVTDAADELFAAIDANQELVLTGDASQGYGVEVQGEATPLPAASPSGSSPSADGAAGAPLPGASVSPGDAAGSVELPSSIAGTTAAQVTCTVPQE